MKHERTLQGVDRVKLLEEFNAAPDDAWFSQKTPAALRDCSEALIERDRWAGGGIPFVRCGRSVRYSKRAILGWLSKHDLLQSTTVISDVCKRGEIV